MNFIMNYPIPNINLVYFFRDVWVEGSAFRAGSKIKLKKKQPIVIANSDARNVHNMASDVEGSGSDEDIVEQVYVYKTKNQ